MATLLSINTSLFSDHGQSSQLAARYVAAWRRANPGGHVIERDLAREPLPHLDAARFGALTTPAAERTPAQQAVVQESDRLVEELRAADVVAIGLPLYNFGVPSTFKAWIDHVARAGVTFRYTASGPLGLLTGKRALVFAARGGRYAGTDADGQTAFVRQFLAFIGITDVEFVYAEGLALGAEARSESLARAVAAIDALEPATLGNAA